MSMHYKNNKAFDVKIAYIGGGSRGWAWKLMSDLALENSISGTVSLYDIDFDAAKNNEIIGNRIARDFPEASKWEYVAEKSLNSSLMGADFVIISILPGTFDEMYSDVHAPEEYGIYQSVGDSVGPGGIIRALRTIPMYEKIALAIKECCPNAWVINYTNPMTACTKSLYEVFPQIKAFGCCHEVFTTQTLFANHLKEKYNIQDIKRNEIKLNVIGINHFTWVTSARFRNIDLFPLYEEIFEENRESDKLKYDLIKYDLFKRYGYIAAAGDSHLAEFCPGEWYLNSQSVREKYNVYLKKVSDRKKDLEKRLQKSADIISGKVPFELTPSGEEGVAQIKALLGLSDIVTNVNLPNKGQISNLPLGAVVETNAYFSADSITPVIAGALPEAIHALTSPVVSIQEMTVKAALTRDLDLALLAFQNDWLVTISIDDAKELFCKMIENTKDYLAEYFK